MAACSVSLADGVGEVAATGGDLHGGGREGGAFGAEDDVFLEHGLGGEGGGAGFENVEAAQGHAGEKVATEGQEVGAVAKAAGHDGDEFGVGFEQAGEQGEEAAVEICHLDADRGELPVGGRADGELAVGRIDDGGVKGAQGGGEERLVERGGGVSDKVFAAHFGGEGDAVAGAEFCAGGKGGAEKSERGGVHLVGGDVEGERARVLGDYAADEGRSERAAARAGIDNAPVRKRAEEERGDEVRQRRRGEELPELALLRLGFWRGERRRMLGKGGRNHRCMVLRERGWWQASRGEA
jgi:hypothetical protein